MCGIVEVVVGVALVGAVAVVAVVRGGLSGRSVSGSDTERYMLVSPEWEDWHDVS